MSETKNDAPEKPTSLPLSAHLMSGWPLALVAVGGAIGGGLGGLAYGINLAIYQSQMALPLKIVLNILTGLAAIGLWLAIGMAILTAQ